MIETMFGYQARTFVLPKSKLSFISQRFLNSTSGPPLTGFFQMEIQKFADTFSEMILTHVDKARQRQGTQRRDYHFSSL